MNKQATLEWLSTQNCPAAYEQFKSGLKIANAGWVCMGFGLGLDLISAIMAASGKTTRGIVVGLGVVGGALEIACISTIAVGYSKMHQAVNVYNVSCGTTAQAKPYWSLQASNNGIGIAYNF